MTTENIESIKKQINEIHTIADPTICMIADQNPDKICRENFELYKDANGEFKMRLIGITLENKDSDKNSKLGTMEQVFEKLNLK